MKVFSLFTRHALPAASICLMLACAKPAASSAEATAAAAHSANPAATMPSPLQNPEDKMPRIKVDEAKKLFDEGKAMIIDVRGTDAYKLNHIKGSLDYSLSRLESGDFKDLPKDKRIISYCTCPTEHSSARASYLLDKAGFKDASALVGGLYAWESAGYGVEKPPAEAMKKN